MQIKVLGAGVAAAYFDRAANVFPPGFLVQWGTGSLLFECSEGIRFRLEQAKFPIEHLHQVAVSHPHADHYAPIHLILGMHCKGLWGGERARNPSLHLYGPDELIRDFPALWNIHLPQEDGKYFQWPKLHLHAMSAGGGISVLPDAYETGTNSVRRMVPTALGRLRVEGTAILKAAPVYHGFGRCGAVGYRLETEQGVVAYSGDTGDCPGVRNMSQGADVFICEASGAVGGNASRYGHLTPADAGSIARDGNVRRLILFHYTGLDSDEAIIKEIRRVRFTGELILAKDGQVITE